MAAMFVFYLYGSNDDSSSTHTVASKISLLIEALQVTLHGNPEVDISAWNYRAFRGAPWKVNELLLGVLQVSFNDKNKMMLSANGVTALLVEVLEKNLKWADASFNARNLELQKEEAELQILLALHCLVELTCVAEGKKKFSETTGATDELISKYESYRSSVGASNIVQRIRNSGQLLRNLRESQATEKDDDEEDGEGEQEGKHLMLSYSRADKERAVQCAEALQKLGIEVWRDEIGSAYVGPAAGSSMIHIMQAAIKKCSYFVCFVSKEYKQFAKCRLECEYAHKRSVRGKLKMVYVMVDENYTTESKVGYFTLCYLTARYVTQCGISCPCSCPYMLCCM